MKVTGIKRKKGDGDEKETNVRTGSVVARKARSWYEM